METHDMKTPTPSPEADAVAATFVSVTCGGEHCFCGASAVRKIGEEIPFDDPFPRRHNLTSYVCARHYAEIMGPLGARHVGFAAPSPAEPVVGEVVAWRILWNKGEDWDYEGSEIFNAYTAEEVQEIEAGCYRLERLYAHPTPMPNGGEARPAAAGGEREAIRHLVYDALIAAVDEHQPKDRVAEVAIDAIILALRSNPPAETAVEGYEDGRPAGWTYVYKNGTGVGRYTVLNDPAPLHAKKPPTKHYGAPITDVRSFFYALASPPPASEAVAGQGEVERLRGAAIEATTTLHPMGLLRAADTADRAGCPKELGEAVRMMAHNEQAVCDKSRAALRNQPGEASQTDDGGEGRS